MSKIQTAVFEGELPTSQQGRRLTPEAIELIELLRAAQKQPMKWVGAAGDDYTKNRTKLKTYAKREEVNLGFRALGPVGKDIVLHTFPLGKDGLTEATETAAEPVAAEPARGSRRK